MRVLVSVSLFAVAAGCLTDPPYRPYAAQPQGYGPQPAPAPVAAPVASTTPVTSTGTTTGTGTTSAAALPGPTYQTNLGPPPAPPKPPPFVEAQATPATTPAAGAAPPASTLPATVAGRYQCWVAGAGMYASSNLGIVTLDFNNTYSTSTNATTGGTYKVDGARVLLGGGPLAGYVGVLETNRNGALLRFRVDAPADPGTAQRAGDHVCYLAH